jgi:hypothetical protein
VKLSGNIFQFNLLLVSNVSNFFFVAIRRPTGDPSKDMLAYDMPALQSHKEELLSSLKELQAENENEKKKILKVVEGISETEKQIEGLLIKNEKTLKVLSSLPSL